MWKFTLFLLLTSVILSVIGFAGLAHYAFIGSGISAILALAGSFMEND